jgi:hypothetical protein
LVPGVKVAKQGSDIRMLCLKGMPHPIVQVMLWKMHVRLLCLSASRVCKRLALDGFRSALELEIRELTNRLLIAPRA